MSASVMDDNDAVAVLSALVCKPLVARLCRPVTVSASQQVHILVADMIMACKFPCS